MAERPVRVEPAEFDHSAGTFERSTAAEASGHRRRSNIVRIAKKPIADLEIVALQAKNTAVVKRLILR
jgi:hypothetical protein